MRTSTSFGLNDGDLKVRVEKSRFGHLTIVFESIEDKVLNPYLIMVLTDEEAASLHFQIQTALLHEEMTDGVSIATS